jgi:hypothetical protein
MNVQNPELSLSGRQLQQRINQWKKKYMDTKKFEENTGAGIENEAGPQSLYNTLENKCPCYHQIDSLLRNKENVTTMHGFNHSADSDASDVGEVAPFWLEVLTESSLWSGRPLNYVFGPAWLQSTKTRQIDSWLQSTKTRQIDLKIF